MEFGCENDSARDLDKRFDRSVKSRLKAGMLQRVERYRIWVAILHGVLGRRANIMLKSISLWNRIAAVLESKGNVLIVEHWTDG